MSVGVPPRIQTDVSLTANIRERIFSQLLIQGGAKRTHVPWPPRSPDLSACDFFLWGYLKSKVCVRKPRTIDDLKVSIREEIAILPQEIVSKCEAEL